MILNKINFILNLQYYLKIILQDSDKDDIIVDFINEVVVKKNYSKIVFFNYSYLRR